MNGKIKGIYINEKDIKLFSYLHAVKVATYEQIHRDVYTEICLDAVGHRIRKLEDAKFVEVGRNRLLLKGKRFVSLKKQTFDDFVRKGGELRIELKSDAIQHDLTLVDIRHKFCYSSKIQAYETENELQTWNLQYKHLNSDALVTSTLGQSHFQIPIEYESTLKKADRYEPFVQKYYQANDFPLVLFLADSQSIINTVVKTEKQLFNWDKPKFFYRLTQDFLSDDTLTFLNCNNAVLSLG